MVATKTIFYLDDDHDDHLIFSMALEEFPHVKLTDFYQPDDLCNRLDDENKPLPDIIFLDINLSGTNGIECLRTIRKKARTKHMPVIMYSTSKYTAELEEALSGDAIHYVEKLPSVSELKKVLKKILED